MRLPRALVQATLRLPPRLLGARPDGALDPTVGALLSLQNNLRLPGLQGATAERARAAFRDRTGTLDPRARRVERRALTVRGADGPLRARLYAPARLEAPSPLVVFFHGGGWVVGDLDTHDGVCAALAERARVRLLAVDYRLAPERPFPAAPEDAYAALVDAHARAAELGADPARLAVCGDSAGGNLSAVAALLCRDRGGPALAFQALVYPGLDASREAPSFERYAEGYLLSRDDVRWFKDRYLPDHHDRLDPRASPLLAPDLRGLPPAAVITAAFDPLVDEGRAYAARLREAGVPVIDRCEADLVHGFLHLAGGVAAANRAFDALAADLRRALAPRAAEVAGRS